MLLLTGLKTSETPERRSSFHLTNQFIYKFTTKVVSRRKTKRKKSGDGFNPSHSKYSRIQFSPDYSTIFKKVRYVWINSKHSCINSVREKSESEPRRPSRHKQERRDQGRYLRRRRGSGGLRLLLHVNVANRFHLPITDSAAGEPPAVSAAVQIKLSCGQWGGVQQQQPTADNGRSYSTTFLNTFSDAITGEATLGKTQTPAGDPLRSEEDGGGASQRKWLPPPPLLPR